MFDAAKLMMVSFGKKMIRKLENLLLIGFLNGRLKKNLNASKPSEHPPSQREKMLKRVGGNIGGRDKITSWDQMGSRMLQLTANNIISGRNLPCDTVH